MIIADILKNGKENKLSAAAVMQITGICSKRELSEEVRRERLAGCLICSTKTEGGGYYLPKDIEEAQEFINTFSREARALFAMQKAFRKYINTEKDGLETNRDGNGYSV